VTTPRGLVVVGASAGGVQALRSLVEALPADLDAAVCVVLHIPRSGTSALPHILDRCGPLPAVHATEGAQLESGRIYVAPANVHLLLVDHRLRLSHGPAENGHRPAADPLFRSAARSWGRAVIGVVLSGSRDDGSFGLATIARHGGVAIVQDPGEALYAGMPKHAIEAVPTARVLPVAGIGAVLGELVPRLRGPDPIKSDDDVLLDAEDAMADLFDVTADELGATPAGFGCPNCHGALFEMPDQPGPRYRCRVGHAWTAATLHDEQSDALETALWTALRSLEEKSALCRRMAESASSRGNSSTAARYTDVTAETEQAGRVIRRLIQRIGTLDTGGDPH
jgi:two-component system chemotaxis response regulator CheB